MHICIHLMTTPDEDEGSSGLMFFRLKSLGLRTMWIGWCPSQNGIKKCAIFKNYQLFFAEFERLSLLYSKIQVVSQSISTFQWYSLAFCLFLGSHLKKKILNLSGSGVCFYCLFSSICVFVYVCLFIIQRNFQATFSSSKTDSLWFELKLKWI